MSPKRVRASGLSIALVVLFRGAVAVKSSGRPASRRLCSRVPNTPGKSGRLPNPAASCPATQLHVLFAHEISPSLHRE